MRRRRPDPMPWVELPDGTYRTIPLTGERPKAAADLLPKNFRHPTGRQRCRTMVRSTGIYLILESESYKLNNRIFAAARFQQESIIRRAIACGK